MPRSTAGCASRLAVVGVLAAVGALAQAPELSIATMPYRPGAVAFTASSNDVEVAVVVRDRGGHVVTGLKAGDFELLRDGKPQGIASFQEQGRVQGPSFALRASEADAAGAAAPAASAALFFDDNSMNAVDLGEARQAAERLLRAGLPEGTRLGVFTASGAVTEGFTTNREDLRAALRRLLAHPRMTPEGGREGLRLNPFLAYMITEDYSDRSPFMTDAVARLRASGQCHTYQACVLLARAASDLIVQQATSAGGDTLGALLRVIEKLRAQPGRRTLVLTSSGFLNELLGAQQAAVEEEALRANVVINSLDAKMLWATLPNRYDANANTGMALAGPEAMNDVLGSLARATGGSFTENSNDLTAGMRGALAPEARYLLSFVPTSMPADGKFHKLSVRVKGPHYTAEARKGYYDAATSMAPLPAAAQAALDAAVEARTTPAAFKVTISGGARRMRQGLPEIHATVWVDAGALPFVKRNGRERDSLVWVMAIFDRQGHFEMGQEGRAEMAFTESSLRETRRTGISAELKLRLPAGRYRVREVVREGNRGLLTALNRYVTVP